MQENDQVHGSLPDGTCPDARLSFNVILQQYLVKISSAQKLHYIHSKKTRKWPVAWAWVSAPKTHRTCPMLCSLLMWFFKECFLYKSFITFIARQWPGAWIWVSAALPDRTCPDNCVLLYFHETFVGVFHANLQKGHKNFITFIAREWPGAWVWVWLTGRRDLPW